MNIGLQQLPSAGRPYYGRYFGDDEASGDRPKTGRVVRVTFVISFDPIMPFGYHFPNAGFLRFVFGHHDVAFDGDHALDDGLVRVPGRYGHDDVAAFDGIEPDRHVRQEHKVRRFVRVERRLHGNTVDSGHGAERVDRRVPDGQAEQNVFHATQNAHLTPKAIGYNANDNHCPARKVR